VHGLIAISGRGCHAGSVACHLAQITQGRARLRRIDIMRVRHGINYLPRLASSPGPQLHNIIIILLLMVKERAIENKMHVIRSAEHNFIPLLRHFSLPFMVKIDVNILSSLLFIALLGEICRRQVNYAL
jgi:hypothetical protein